MNHNFVKCNRIGKKRLDKQSRIEYYIKADFAQAESANGEVAELAEGARLEIV